MIRIVEAQGVLHTFQSNRQMKQGASGLIPVFLQTKLNFVHPVTFRRKPIYCAPKPMVTAFFSKQFAKTRIVARAAMWLKLDDGQI
jgi:hypothetical protein